MKIRKSLIAFALILCMSFSVFTLCGCDLSLGHTHDWSEWEISILPTCAQAGEEKRNCLKNASHIQRREIDPQHDWADWVLTTPATDSVQGEKTRVCKQDISHIQTQLLGHNKPDEHGYINAYIIGGRHESGGNAVLISDVDDLKHWRAALGNLAKKYTETFFASCQVLMVFFSAGSGGDRFKFGDYDYRDGIISVTIEQTVSGMTCDMAYWLAVIEIEAGYLPDTPVMVNGWLSKPMPKENWPQVFVPEQFITISNINPGIRPDDCNIIDTSDGWIMVGTESGWATNGFIAKFNKNGNKMWERYMTMTDGNIQSPCAVIELSDGYLMSVEFILDGYRYPYFVKFGKTGELIWMKQQTASHIKPYNGGFVGIVGDGGGLCIVQLDKDGNEIMKRNFSSQILDANITGFYQLYLLPDGDGFLVHGSMNYPSATSCIISISEDGTVRWCKDIGAWEYNRFIVTENRILNLKLTTIEVYDFAGTLISEKELPVNENHYHNFKPASKIGDNYFVVGFYSDGYASCYVLGFDSFGYVIFEITRHNVANTGYGVTYHGVVATENGVAVLAGYRHFGNPVTEGPHETTLHFLYYDLTTKTFTESRPLI